MRSINVDSLAIDTTFGDVEFAEATEGSVVGARAFFSGGDHESTRNQCSLLQAYWFAVLSDTCVDAAEREDCATLLGERPSERRRRRNGAAGEESEGTMTIDPPRQAEPERESLHLTCSVVSSSPEPVQAPKVGLAEPPADSMRVSHGDVPCPEAQAAHISGGPLYVFYAAAVLPVTQSQWLGRDFPDQSAAEYTGATSGPDFAEERPSSPVEPTRHPPNLSTRQDRSIDQRGGAGVPMGDADLMAKTGNAMPLSEPGPRRPPRHDDTSMLRSTDGVAGATRARRENHEKPRAADTLDHATRSACVGDVQVHLPPENADVRRGFTRSEREPRNLVSPRLATGAEDEDAGRLRPAPDGDIAKNRPDDGRSSPDGAAPSKPKVCDEKLDARGSDGIEGHIRSVGHATQRLPLSVAHQALMTEARVEAGRPSGEPNATVVDYRFTSWHGRPGVSVRVEDVGNTYALNAVTGCQRVEVSMREHADALALPLQLEREPREEEGRDHNGSTQQEETDQP